MVIIPKSLQQKIEKGLLSFSNKYNDAIAATAALEDSIFGNGELDTKFDNAIVHVENSTAAAQGKDLYKQIGVTGDIGKYQVNPRVLNDYSKVWLGKKYTPEEFLNDNNAQEKFFRAFKKNVIKRYGLTPTQGLVAWHNGMGKAGDMYQTDENGNLLKDEKGQAIKTTTAYDRIKLLESINHALKTKPNVKKYVSKAQEILK